MRESTLRGGCVIRAQGALLPKIPTRFFESDIAAGYLAISKERLRLAATTFLKKATSTMITGSIKSQVDQIWNAFWSGGI
ncbi:MAG TPA: hypothetical protein VFE77_12850, partial [Rhodanobacter sp.]|nr:hypothetical protein [Rhodanobacter sp.]